MQHSSGWAPSPGMPQGMPAALPNAQVFAVGVGQPVPDLSQSALLRGPFLRFGGYDPITHLYRASVLVVIQEQEYPGGSWATEEPTLAYLQGSTNAPGSARALLLYRYKSACFYRFDFSITLSATPEVLDYTITHRTAYPYQKRSQFQLPAIGQPWRWGFHSCNGFEHPEDAEIFGGIQPLWHDVLYCARTPLHVMVGGGDQLYNDAVWEKPAMKRWLEIPRAERQHMGVPPDLMSDAEDHYFSSYLRHWCEPAFTDCLATVPQMMVWDDHDIWDGWGSYSEQLMLSPTFQAVFEKARLYYCIFQQHSTPTLIHEQNQVFGEFGWNWIACLGQNTAIVVTDSRSERTREMVLLPGTYTMIQQRIAQLPSTIKHVVVLTTVPFIYPQIPAAETSLQYMTGQHGFGSKMLKKFMHGTGLAATVNSAFGEPELLDDLLDHWSAEIHVPEKIAMLHMLQELALARGFRFTFLSGDVHVAGVGRFCTAPPIHPTPEQLLSDHRFMYQVISSAIANKPPPPAVITALNTSASPVMIDANTREKMMSTFQDAIGTSRLKGARNWCLISELPDGALNFQLRIEEVIRGTTVTSVDVVAPRLFVPSASAAAPLTLRPFELTLKAIPNLGRTLHAEASMRTSLNQRATYSQGGQAGFAPAPVAPAYIGAPSGAPAANSMPYNGSPSAPPTS